MEELAPGFRFYPTEEELVTFYLNNLLQGNRTEQLHRVIPIIQFYEIEPWHLPKHAGESCRVDPEQWFFFTPRQEREVHGGRPTRTTASGYWKATGSPNYVYSSDNRVVGLKKTMVFYKGKAPTGRKTKWKLNEYRAIEDTNPSRTAIPKLRNEFSLCRVYVTSGSLRAFDRRPLEAAAKQTQPLADDRATTSSHNTTMAARTSSPDTSYSGEDRADRPESTGATDLELPDYLQEPPLWDWEELNWH